MKTVFIFVMFGAMNLCSLMDAEKIIILTPFATRSHKNVLLPLVEELATRSHQITLVSPMISAKVIPNVKEIDIAKNLEILSEMEGNIFNRSVKGGLLEHLRRQKIIVQKTGENFLTHPEIQALITSGQTFDLAIINGRMNDFCYMVAPLIAKFLIVFTPGSMPPPTPLSSPISLGETHMPHLAMPSHMTFFQRIINAAYYLLIGYVYPYFLQQESEKMVWKYHPEAPSIAEGKMKISLLLNNADPILSSPKPIGSASIDVGGMHCRNPQPLPKVFIDFINADGGEGIIVFSLGSVVPAKTMPEFVRQEFIAAFSQLKQKVIWKYEDSLEELPPNVITTPWIPQQDILAHPNVRLFITHGGILSLQEAIFHGVPMIGVPLFADQHGNVARIVELGLGEQLNIYRVNSTNILQRIRMILYNDSYAENMKKYSDIMKNQMDPPVKRAAFWVEYVLRHRGASHLNDSSNKLLLLQYFLLDVATVFVVFLVIFIVFFVFVLRKIYRKLITQKKNNKKKE